MSLTLTPTAAAWPLLAAACFLGASSLAGSPCEVTPSPTWKASIVFPEEPFRVEGSSGAQPDWVKFTILLCDPTTVYFQDSNAFPLHYDFASQHLDPFLGLSPAELDQVTLRTIGQQAVLGAVLMPYTDGPALAEYAIQLVGQDPYDAAFVADLFQTVRAAIEAPPGTRAFYFPTFEQTQAALDQLDDLAAQGIEVGSVSRWADGNACYAEGWALGRLNFIPAPSIDAAYLDGSLSPDDILLTDGVPAEIPFVAGIVSLAPSTPNSHVAILAATFGVPFVHLALASDAERAQALIGRRVVLRSEIDPGGLLVGCRTRLIDVEGQLEEGQIDDLLALKLPAPLDLDPIESFGAVGGPVDPLLPTDSRHFGGKAAHYGLLRQSIPARCPVAAALSFDVWQAFLGQELPGGSTLREVIDARLAGYAYPPDFQALAQDLAAVRALFVDDQATAFAPGLREAIFALLQDPQYGFDPTRKIRFRSSTNVEDTDQFSGAGLYDSVSGCLADDLDGDAIGPSVCDPSRPQERGVLRAIRRVFASFYNDNAFFERLRFGVDPSTVGMAVLVHHSFPDEFELANGVATLVRTSNGLSKVHLVTQEGAVSVANPPAGATPEEVEALVFIDGNVQLSKLQESSLVVLGQTVLEWQTDYIELASLLKAAADRYQQVTGRVSFTLDLEYKKLAPGGAALPGGGLAIKQLRSLPQGDTTPSVVPFLVNEPVDYCLDQSTAFDLSLNHLGIFANHRLKSKWSIRTRSFRMTLDELASSLFADVEWTFTDECGTHGLAGEPATWPGYSFTFEDDVFSGPTATDRWTLGDLGNPRAYTLSTERIGPFLVAPTKAPVLTLRDLGRSTPDGRLQGCLLLRVDYQDEEPEWACHGACESLQTRIDHGFVCPCPTRRPGSLRLDRVYTADGVTVTTSFYWPPEADGFGALAAFIDWEGPTVIEGLTSQPIAVTDDFARTYEPERHGFGEDLLVQPHLDPDVPEFLKRELEVLGVEQIHVTTNLFDGDAIRLLGPDGTCAVDATDLDVFEDCFAGSGVPPLPTPPRTAGECLALWDFDGDLDIDCADWSDFQFAWDPDGPLPTLEACMSPTDAGRIPPTVVLDRGSSATRVRFDWAASCSPGASHHAVYEGALGDWYSHRPLTCSGTGGAGGVDLPVSQGDRYYLVVPVNPTGEGSYGPATTVPERPAGSSACATRQHAGACPG